MWKAVSSAAARWPIFCLTNKTLLKRLSLLFPDVDMAEVNIVSTELCGNASFVNYVRRHQLTHIPSGAMMDLVEKSIRKLCFISSLEATFYRERHVLANSQYFQHPRCYGLIETPWESLIYVQYVHGHAPRMQEIAGDVARGIAEIESLSHRHLQASPRNAAARYWQMDFFRPWYMLRPRFNHPRLFIHLRTLALEDDSFDQLESRLRRLIPQLRAMALTAKRSPRCFCHLDYLRKNLILSEQGLHLIDWSEVKVGRVGFDAGAYLSALFRRSTMAQYLTARDEFLSVYQQALEPGFDRSLTLNNVRYVFLLNTLWYCMRPQTIDEYRRTGKLGQLREKFEYLLSLKAG